jgi:hypothetical protein
MYMSYSSDFTIPPEIPEANGYLPRLESTGYWKKRLDFLDAYAMMSSSYKELACLFGLSLRLSLSSL